MTRNKLIEKIYREFELEKDPLSKKTNKLIRKFTETYAPITDFKANDDFFTAFWMAVDAIEVDIFRFGFNIAMELRNTDDKRALNEHAATQTI